MRGLLLLPQSLLLLLLLPHLALNMLRAGQVQVKQVKRPQRLRRSLQHAPPYATSS